MRQRGELLLGCKTKGHSGPCPGVNCCLVVRPMATLGLVLEVTIVVLCVVHAKEEPSLSVGLSSTTQTGLAVK